MRVADMQLSNYVWAMLIGGGLGALLFTNSSLLFAGYTGSQAGMFVGAVIGFFYALAKEEGWIE